MGIGDGDPPLGDRLEAMLRDALLAVVDGDGAIEGDPDPHRAPRHDPGNGASN